uniref:Uncharacterized protein n=1 Tax=Oryza sativa subsp. japonica TaxID=39947 RepID=Q84S57_ORYSJ|nr:hypothetical protein [Oryza sativa Japonica Group]BAD30128.1 hypothetical protein [Oryza sativa Japonica Group]
MHQQWQFLGWQDLAVAGKGTVSGGGNIIHGVLSPSTVSSFATAVSMHRRRQMGRTASGRSSVVHDPRCNSSLPGKFVSVATVGMNQRR